MTSCRPLLSHLADLNYANKGTQFKNWLKIVDKALPVLICAKLAQGDCRSVLTRGIKCLRALHKPGNSRSQKLVYDRALTAAYNCHRCFNSCNPADQTELTTILTYDVYDSISRLRKELKTHRAFSLDWLENTYHGDVKPHHIWGIPYQLFLLLDSLIPYDGWRKHLTLKNTHITKAEERQMHTNPLFHKLR